jgi:predicted dinucleotide-utilizing enzyme
MKRIGVLGFGNLGKFIVEACFSNDLMAAHFQPVVVWNRSSEKFNNWKYRDRIECLSGKLDKSWKKIEKAGCDLILECSHPSVSWEFGKKIIDFADYFPTSLTAFARASFREELIHKLNKKLKLRAVFIPTGAAWGLHDIKRMADFNHIKKILVKMTFEGPSLHLYGDEADDLINYLSSARKKDELIAKGAVDDLALVAPHNVNTMAALAMCVDLEDWSKVEGELWASKNKKEHLVEIKLEGSNGFQVECLRINPAKGGNVTGSQTFRSFIYSLYESRNGGKGIVFC